MDIEDPWPFQGRVVWLTPEQGGRRRGLPQPNPPLGYAINAFVPPHAVGGSASFVLRGFEIGAWMSEAEAGWMVVRNEGPNLVVPGTVVVCAEGPRTVGYFHVERVLGSDPLSSGD